MTNPIYPYPYNRLGEVVLPQHFVAPVRFVHTIFLHCTASSSPSYGVFPIHLDHIKRKFGGFGYHYFIEFDGTLRLGRALEADPVAQGGHNKGTIAICLQGLKVSDFTPAQFHTLTELCQRINTYYRSTRAGVIFRGHKEVAARECPVFDYRRVLNLDSQGRMPLASPAGENKSEKPVDAAGPVRDDAPVGWKQEVRNFQRSKGLQPDGVIGELTWGAIRPYLKIISEK